jgi:hypothetical protein
MPLPLFGKKVSMYLSGLHAVQTSQYVPLLLPPFHFEKSKHWMVLKKATDYFLNLTWPSLPRASGLCRLSRIRETHCQVPSQYQTEKYQRHVSSHVIAQTAPISPSTHPLDIAMDALWSLVGGSKRSGL